MWSKASVTSEPCAAPTVPANCQRPLGRGTSRWMRWPVTTWPPCCTSQRIAASGNSAPRSVRGSSRLEPPRPLNRLSCSTRKNTWPLASRAGVLSADTQSGSMNSAISRGVSGAHRSATEVWGAQRKPRSCQAMAVRSRATLSCQPQPLARTMPSSASSGGGRSGSCRPWPSGNCRVSGRRSSAVVGSMPTRRIRRRLSV